MTHIHSIQPWHFSFIQGSHFGFKVLASLLSSVSTPFFLGVLAWFSKRHGKLQAEETELQLLGRVHKKRFRNKTIYLHSSNQHYTIQSFISHLCPYFLETSTIELITFTDKPYL